MKTTLPIAIAYNRSKFFFFFSQLEKKAIYPVVKVRAFEKPRRDFVFQRWDSIDLEVNYIFFLRGWEYMSCFQVGDKPEAIESILLRLN